MDGAKDDEMLLASNSDDFFHNVRGCSSIETAGRFVEKEQRWLFEEANGNRETPLLTSTQAVRTGVSTAIETHFGNHLVDNRRNFRFVCNVV